MHYRTLGRTGREVSEVACGTFRSFDIPGPRGGERVLALMRENLARGVNLFDSAPMYGHSEANIGHAVQHLGGADTTAPRAFYIATKVLQNDLAGAREQIAHSFRVIGGRIDLLQIHNMAGWRRVLPHLAELKAEGRIGATGITHYDPGAFAEMEQAMKTGDVDVIQVPYNVAERDVEQRLLPLAEDMNVGVLVMTPIQPMFRRTSLLQTLQQLDLTPFRDYGVTDAGALALKYLLSKDERVILLPATSRPERVRANAAVSDAPPLPPELIARVERHVGG